MSHISTSSREKRKHILENVSHYLTAFAIVMKGVAKMEDPEKLLISVFFIVAGVLVALGTFFHNRLDHLVHNFKRYVFAVECIIVAIVGYLFFKEGKVALSIVYFVASFAFFVALVIHFVKPKPRQHH